MPITLITGANGHGKGQVIIREILRLQEENDKLQKAGKPRRRIFANIHGINAPGIKPLKDVKPIPSDKIFFGKQDKPDMPPPDDCWLPEVGDIFIYDECQNIDWVKQKSGALSTDIRVTSLEEHRHWGLDIYFLTQSPNYIHSHIFGLVSPHWYVERPLGIPFTNVFIFNKAQKTPESPTVKKRADDQKQITLGKKYGQYYKSSAEHNMKSTIPLKVKIAIAALVLCFAYSFYKYSQTKYFKKDTNKAETVATQTNNPTSAVQATSAPGQTLTQEQIIQTEINRMKLENDLAIAKAENEMLKARLTPAYQAEANNPEIRVAGVFITKGKCKAYNTYGDRLIMSQIQCKGYRGNLINNRQNSPVATQVMTPMPDANSVTTTQINPVTTVTKVTSAPAAMTAAFRPTD